jgi:hypothetical protein
VQSAAHQAGFAAVMVADSTGPLFEVSFGDWFGRYWQVGKPVRLLTVDHDIQSRLRSSAEMALKRASR